MTIEETITQQRAERGLSRTDARDILCELAIDAGYTFTQIAEQWRSGRGDERTDLPGGPERWLVNNPGAETFDEYRRRVIL